MKPSYSIQEFCFAEQYISLVLPNAIAIKNKYGESAKRGEYVAFPYWAKLWPSAIALTEFLAKNNSLIKDKVIFEIAAGLGLPSIFCTQYAKYVICSDYAEEALFFVNQSISLNKIKNIETKQFDWNEDVLIEEVDMLLLSDINYNPGSFAALYKLINKYLANGVSVLISTPQRLMAKPFIEQLLPFCVEKTTIPIKTTNEVVEIFIMQLQKQG